MEKYKTGDIGVGVASTMDIAFTSNPNLVPRVLRLFGQQLVARRDSGVLEFHYRTISAVKHWEPLRSLYRAANQKNYFFSNSFSSRLPADQEA